MTVLVYPALGRTDAGGWRAAHERHTRSIAPVVGLVYGSLVVAAVWLLASGPDALGVVAVVLAVAAMVTTTVAAAPTHGRLLDHDGPMIRRLLRVDQVRLGFAAAAAAAAAFNLMS